MSAIDDLRAASNNHDNELFECDGPPINDGYVAPFLDSQEIVSWMFPIEDKDATLYYNPDVLRTPLCRERALADFGQRHRGIKPAVKRLSPVDLKYFSISRYPLAEQVFRQRGYVSDVDFKSKVGKPFEPSYVRQSKAAAGLQFMIVDAILDEFSRLEELPWLLDRRVALEGLSGTRGYPAAPVPLVEHEGLLVGCSDLGQERRVHLAWKFESEKELAEAKKDPMGLVHGIPDEIYDQVAFEVAHSRRLFDGASPLTLMAWHTQVLAYLRKWAWTKEFLEIDLTRHHCKAMRRLPNQGIGATPEVLRSCLNDAAGAAFRDKALKYTVECENAYENLGELQFSMRLSEYEKQVAMFHGSMFQAEPDPTDSYQGNQLYVLRPLTVWIGELKRKRCAVLNNVAGTLFELFDEFPDEIPVFADELSFNALTMLRDRAALIEENASPVHVVYEWARDAENPRSIDVIDGVLVIRGPLLSFPLRASHYWNEKAEIIRRNGGFELRRPR